MKNLSLNLILFSLCISLFVSCKDGENKTDPATDTPAEQTSQAEANDSLKVNPAHGLPGHRCDLPVGAPLTASAGSTPTPAPTSELPSTSVSPIRVDQTPDVNPPHGEPGHDCAVPVGAPLKE